MCRKIDSSLKRFFCFFPRDSMSVFGLFISLLIFVEASRNIGSSIVCWWPLAIKLFRRNCAVMIKSDSYVS